MAPPARAARLLQRQPRRIVGGGGAG